MKMRAVLFSILTLLTASPVLSADAVSDVLEKSGVTGGLIIQIGIDDPGDLAGLLVDENCVVQVLDKDAKKVEGAKAVLKTEGLYGRITVGLFDGEHLPYVDNLVNVILASGKPARADGSNRPGWQVAGDEIARVLAPRGVAIVAGKTDTRHLKLVARSQVRLEGWTLLEKAIPPEIDDWTHYLYGPENNAVSKDVEVGISRNLQWIMPPSWGRHHNLVPSMSVMVSGGGRIYYIVDEAPIAVRGPSDNWQLVCRDAFNGLLLWKKSIANWGWKKWSKLEVGGSMRFKRPDQLFRRLVADEDRIFVTLGFNEPVTALDGKSGAVVREYKGTENTSTILHRGNALYLARNVLGENPGKDIMAVDCGTGNVLWEHKGFSGITSRGDELMAFRDTYLTLGKDKVFFFDNEDVVALDVETGNESWRSPRPMMEKGVLGQNKMVFRNYATLVHHDGIVYLGQLLPSKTNLNGWQQKDMMICAMDEKTGRKIWEHKGMSLAHFTPPDLFVNNGMVWTMKKSDVSLVGLDAKTGKVRKEYPAKEILVGHHHRCYRNRASKNLYLYGEEGIEYIDFETGDVDVHHWLRGACAYGIMPANGLIYLPTHACGCHANKKLHGFIALADRRSEVGGRRTDDRGNEPTRLIKGGAYSQRPTPNAQRSTSNGADWPMFRGNVRRSGSVKTELSADVKQAWTVQLQGRVTQPVVVGDMVYVAEKDSHAVHALAVKDGEKRWRFMADGRIDSAPTCHNDSIFFGTRSGSVYCLRASDGELAWRFRVAPTCMKLTAYGQLESVWPVHGSVLVQNGKLYCTAGRSANLDSGIHFYELDCVTGKILKQKVISADKKAKGELDGTILADILSSDGSDVFMRGTSITSAAKGKGGGYLRPQDGGLLDNTLFMSSYRSYGGVQAQLLSFDDKAAFGLMAQKKLIAKSYPHGILSVGSGYGIFSVDLAAQGGAGKDRRGSKSKSEKKSFNKKWQRKIPVRADSILLTDNFVCYAGAPDIVDRKDPWGAFEDRKGGVLLVVSREDGKTVCEHKLESAPVFDGLSAAQGMLFVALKNGEVQCWK
jgi:outer membrane protein assembly factor BamB